MMNNETVCAVSTAEGEGGIAIVRVSGDRAEDILRSVFVPARGEIKPRMLSYGRAVDREGGMIDEVMAVLLPAPATYTREDMAEVQCHGGRVCARRIVSRMIELGARPAQPGEFTKRAFMNGRIDLSRAEAVMALIGAGGEAAARASVRQLQGGVSGFVRGCADRIRELLSAIGAGIDFPEEVDESETERDIIRAADEIIQAIDKGVSARGARIVREGASVVLTGRPNVGKSSIMNALLDQDRAIVTDIPGTTRDVLTERLTLGGVSCELSDTAGLRQTSDVIEKMGVDRAEQALAAADIIIKVYEPGEKIEDETDPRMIVVVNKVDLEEKTAASANCVEAQSAADANTPLFRVSALTGEGMDVFTAFLTERLRALADTGDAGMTVDRHIRLALDAREALESARAAAEQALPADLIEIDLRRALDLLCEITGENATEAVIDGIFKNFCVGK